jgi:1-deoxyxylulose-5-phosphate synthase
MRYRRLGRTKLMVSEVSLGTAELGMNYGIRTGTDSNKPDREDAEFILNSALDKGVNFIDTAAAYGDSEKIIGRAIHHRRDEFYIATKCLHHLEEGYSVKASRASIRASIDQSLSNLQMETIDLIQVHGRIDVDMETRMIQEHEVADELERARTAGKVRYLGYSSYSEDASLAAIDDGKWDTLQFAYNIFDQETADRVIPIAQENDIGLVIRSALLKGALTEKAQHLPPHLNKLADHTDALTRLIGPHYTLPQAALRFVLSNQMISTIIVGVDKLAYLDEAVAVSDGAELPSDILAVTRTMAIDDPELINPGNWGIP